MLAVPFGGLGNTPSQPEHAVLMYHDFHHWHCADARCSIDKLEQCRAEEAHTKKKVVHLSDVWLIWQVLHDLVHGMRFWPGCHYLT